jgi:2-iminobutanoate/2-iminopropanoate deaminase
MRRKAITPATIHRPFGSYNHGVLVEGPPATLHMSGQVGMAADGHVPDSVEGQTELVFANIDAILKAAGLERRHIVKLTTYLTDPAFRQLYMPIRNAWIEEPWPASTLVAVKALAEPRFLIEIEAFAVGDA